MAAEMMTEDIEFVPMQVGADVIERILNAVGSDHIPVGLDKAQLAIGLQSCLATYWAAVDRNSNRRRKDKLRRLKSLRAAAARFKAQLTPDELWQGNSANQYLRSEVEYFIERLDWDIGEIEHELEWGPDWSEAIHLKRPPREYADRWKSRSPLEWVAGHYLPQLFKEQFKAAPSFHRRSEDNLPDGPMIRFVERALVELDITRHGVPYSRETIAKAVTDIRTGRARKKRSSTVGRK